MPGSPVVFFVLAAVAVATAVGMLLSRNAIYSALFLVLNFATVAVLYLILGAPFIALSQITVYAGSIMVLFLFVIMLLGAEHLPRGKDLPWQPFLAIPLALILVAVLGFNLFARVGPTEVIAQVPADYGAPASVGQFLFSQYMLPFEVTAVILLVAVVGAIMLARPDKPSGSSAARRNGNIPAQATSSSQVEEKSAIPAVPQDEAIKQ
ncbi:MAG TPA: NADH-quinone oxidoreductase subunit J [Anaerolineaceae bacterium]